MDSKQENKVSMLQKTHAFFGTNISSYSTIPILNTKVVVFDGILDTIFMKDAVATNISKGYTGQKDLYRQRMHKKTLVAAGAMAALGAVTDDIILRDRGKINQKLLDNTRDNDEVSLYMNILQSLSANATALIPYGIDSTFIDDYNTTSGLYNQAVPTTGEQKAIRVAAGKKVDKLLVEIMALLHDVIDPIMKSTMLLEPELYDEYLNVRLIDDNASGHSTPDIILTLNPNSFTIAETIVYLASRSFRVKNKGAAAINWGLSTDTVSFTNTPHIAPAGGTTTKLSSTLGPNGDNLLFQNPTVNPIDIEVTIIE